MSLAENYPETFAGFTVYDCALRASGYCFLLYGKPNKKNNDEPDKRMASYFPDIDFEGKPLCNGHKFFGFENPHLVVAHEPKEQATMLGLSGSVAVLGGGEGGMQDSIPTGQGLALEAIVEGATTIDGYVYAVGGWRSVAKRVAANHWESIVDRASMPEPESANGIDPGGFCAISAFSADDIYCVGGEGDAWRFDGTTWHRCPLGTKMDLYAVCCAGDGFVYIGAQSGCLLKGRGDQWKIIHRDRMALPFKDLVWFEGRVWCTSDYGLWTIENDKLVESALPPRRDGLRRQPGRRLWQAAAGRPLRSHRVRRHAVGAPAPAGLGRAHSAAFNAEVSSGLKQLRL